MRRRPWFGAHDTWRNSVLNEPYGVEVNFTNPILDEEELHHQQLDIPFRLPF